MSCKLFVAPWLVFRGCRMMEASSFFLVSQLALSLSWNDGRSREISQLTLKCFSYSLGWKMKKKDLSPLFSLEQVKQEENVMNESLVVKLSNLVFGQN